MALSELAAEIRIITDKCSVESTTSLLSCSTCHLNIWSWHSASWHMATTHANAPIILQYQSAVRGVPLCSHSLLLTHVWWQTPEKNLLLVIELTSFSKYQEPRRIIKIPILRYIFLPEAKQLYAQKQSCTCWIWPERRKRLVFSFMTFLWSRHFSSWCLNYSGRVALRGVGIGGTSVISTRESVITQTDSTAATRPRLQPSAGLAVCKRVSGSMSLLFSFVHYTLDSSV